MTPLRRARKASPAVCRKRAVCFFVCFLFVAIFPGAFATLCPIGRQSAFPFLAADHGGQMRTGRPAPARHGCQRGAGFFQGATHGAPAPAAPHPPARHGGRRGAGFSQGATHGAVARAAADAGGGNTAPVRQRQNGATVLKNRPSQPMAWASVFPPPPRDSTRTLATRVEAMMLPGCNALGSTVPEKRSTSTFWFTPICFSPVTTRWPLGSTSTPVVVMAPEKVLALAVPPLPEKVLSALVPRDSLPVRVLPMNGRACTPADTCDWRSTVEEDFWLAVTFSTICIVTLSPTMRARRSSKAGR